MDSGYPTREVVKTASPEMLELAPKAVPWNTGPSLRKDKCQYTEQQRIIGVADPTYPDGEGGINIGRGSGGPRAPFRHRPSLAAIDGQPASEARLLSRTRGSKADGGGLGKAGGQAREHLESRGRQ